MNELVREIFAPPDPGDRGQRAGSPSHVSDRCISEREFARYQRRSLERDLSDLVWQCCDQFRYAYELLRPGAALPEWLVRRSAPDLSNLLLPWDKLCVSYRSHLFDPQLDFFEDQEQRELTRWSAFRKRRLFAPVLQAPDLTRCVLEQVGFLASISGAGRTSLEAAFREIKHDNFGKETWR